MRRRLIVLRPEPGNAATCAAIRAGGVEAVALPLFEVRPVPWEAPDPAGFDALVLTSANAVRHAGPQLVRYGGLPVVTVGAATARAAEAAGLAVAAMGEGDAADLPPMLASIGAERPLHLTGRDHRGLGLGETVVVYASEPDDPAPGALAVLEGSTALIHSARAGARLATLASAAGLGRATIAVAAISPAALRAAGEGWRAATAAPVPRDDALIAAALSIDRPDGGRDKVP
ncbi:uroporphyrinogen-III synthase [Sphingomonas spermidinifaciens]|uniref:Uroporphyrinogen-III synthase n=1 Tax=Sphingomonas spermidinifaciens TaxID=1141889 RepID=A0A2A4B1D9_9SPHN|nr:uroporphyrinogen-III synthase [Sphingomonas spermidinifaciens]PCD01857.1 uroporphyrinogen-III synthase [Sphingomonas spermidinifaciens]